MPSQSFRCPSCDASLTYDEANPATTVTCDYCNNTVIVPENLRRQQLISKSVTSAQGALKKTGCLIVAVFLVVAVGVVFLVVSVSRQVVPEESVPVESQDGDAAPAADFGGYLEELLVIGGEEGSGPGFFDDTRWLGVDGDGRIYAADFDNKGRVQVFAADGQFLNQWRTQREGIIGHMVVSRDGLVTIFEPGSGIFIYDGSSGELRGELADIDLRFEALAVNLAGEIVAVGRDGMAWFNASGEVLRTFLAIFENIESDVPISISNIAVDAEDNLYVATTFNSAIYKFNKEGVFLDRIGQEGDDVGDFTSPSALAVDGQGRIFVDDFSDILVFDENGRYLDTISVGGIAFTLLIDTQNNLYRMNRNDNRIEKYALLN